MTFVRLRNGRILNLRMIASILPVSDRGMTGAKVMMVNTAQYYEIGVDAEDLATIIQAIEKTEGLM